MTKLPDISKGPWHWHFSDGDSEFTIESADGDAVVRGSADPDDTRPFGVLGYHNAKAMVALPGLLAACARRFDDLCARMMDHTGPKTARDGTWCIMLSEYMDLRCALVIAGCKLDDEGMELDHVHEGRSHRSRKE